MPKPKMNIPTEPIGSIPRPPALIEAVAASGDGTDPALEPLYDEAIRDTIERFEATGSPVITDGEQRKYHNFWTYCVHGLPNTAPDGFKIPFSAGHIRRMPRLTAGPFRYKRYADSYLGRGPALRPRAGQAGGHLALGAEPHVPGRRDPRLLARAVHRRPAARARDRGPRAACEKGAHKVQIDFTEGRLAVKIDPSGDLLHSFIDLNNLALSRFSAEDRAAHRRAHLPRRRPRLDPQRRRRLRRAAAQPVRAEGRELLHRAGGRDGPRPRPEDHPRAPEAGPAGLRRRRRADRPARRDAGGGPRPGPRGGRVHSRSSSWARPTTAASRRSATTRRPPANGVRQDPRARGRHGDGGPSCWATVSGQPTSEERRIRTAALKNIEAILSARQRAESELVGGEAQSREAHRRVESAARVVRGHAREHR